MKIWIFNHYASPPDRAGGTRHYDFGEILAAAGHDVTIFASSFSHFSRSEERLADGERARVQDIGGVRFVWVRTTPYSANDHRRLLNMLSYAAGVIWVQRKLPRPDVIVGSCVHPFAVVAAFAVGAGRRVPFVFEVRDLWPQTLIDMGALRENGAVAVTLQAIERYLYRRARTVISLLPGAAGYLTRAGVPASKVSYVPNGVARRTVSGLPDGPAARALTDQVERWRAAGYLVAGYVGSHGPANGLDVLIEAARVLRDRGVGNIMTVFVGDGPDKQRCMRLAQQCALDTVVFFPPVAKEAVAGVLGSLDVALFPLRDIPVFRYGLSSNKLFDYLASGRPVVSSCGVPDNPVQLSRGGICVPAESPEAVADALTRLAAAGAAGRYVIGERGRAWVYEHHDVTMLADRFLQAVGGTGQ
jgi:glycosyltransferase involved in cell wall biosynthesis